MSRRGLVILAIVSSHVILMVISQRIRVVGVLLAGKCL